MTRPLLVLSFAALAILACSAAGYTSEVVTAPKEQLKKGASARIATPLDASFGAKRYAGSGATTAAAVLSAFSRYTASSDLAPDCAGLDCLRDGSKHYDYYVVPQILHWEDRATEWSGKRDKLEVKITVYGSDGVVLASSVISAKSKLMTFGGDHPQDLLQKPLNLYAQTLF